MTWWRRLGRLVFVLLLLVTAAASLYVWKAFPALDGERRAAGLMAGVSIERDSADITHIKATSRRDAWFALGYVHAQERGWQMEFNRRLMRGRLSEVLGEATLETDKLLRTLGITQVAQRQLQQMPAEARDALQAYSDGVQSFYTEGSQALSPEFQLLGVKPGVDGDKAWEPVDSVGWALMMALDLSGNWGNEYARLLAAKVVDTKHLWDLFPPYPGEPPVSNVDFAALYARLGVYRGASAPAKVSGLAGTQSAAAVETALQAWSDTFTRDAGVVEGRGSNNWVVDGSRSASGKPLLANDPHLGLSAPAIWYLARLQAPPASTGGPALDVIGATLPGLPFVVLGRTRALAWGFTNTAPDVQDLYLEQINPADPQQYRVPDVDGHPAWARFELRPEVIKVKNRPDVAITVRSTRHGPVLSDAQRAHGDLLDLGRYVLALRWSALDPDNNTVLAMQHANEAQSVDQLVAAFSDYHSPMQNVVMADTGGHIAYKAVGKVPLRRPDNDILGMAPSPGWDARYDWAGWIPYTDTPQQGLSGSDGATAAIHWIATANQRITPPGYRYFMGQDWAVPYRFERIEQLLAATPRHDMASMKAMQADLLSPSTLRLLPFLRAAVSDHSLARAAQTRLSTFDGVMRADSAAALVFAVWVDELTRGLLVPRLGPERFAALYGKRQFRGTVEVAMEQGDAWWCAPLRCTEQAGAALTRALVRLQKLYGDDVGQWQWGKAHPALSGHRPFGSVAVLASWFDVSVPSGGDAFTLNAGQYWLNENKSPFANRQAASMRAVYDLSDLEKSEVIYQTGQSGLVFSPRYRDMATEWAEVRYRPLQLDPKIIRHTLKLVP